MKAICVAVSLIVFLAVLCPAAMALDVDEEGCFTETMLHLMLGEDNEARTLVNDCASEYGDSENVLKARGYYYLDRGEYGKAIVEFTHMRDVAKGEWGPWDARHVLAYAYLLNGDTAAALEEAEKIVEESDYYESPEQVLKVMLYYMIKPVGLKKTTDYYFAMNGERPKRYQSCEESLVLDDDGNPNDVAACGFDQPEMVTKAKGLRHTQKQSNESERRMYYRCTAAGCATVSFVMSMNTSVQTHADYGGKRPDADTGADMRTLTTVMYDPPMITVFPVYPGKQGTSHYGNTTENKTDVDSFHDDVKTDVKMNYLGAFTRITTKYWTERIRDSNSYDSSNRSESDDKWEVLGIEPVEAADGSHDDCLKGRSSVRTTTEGGNSAAKGMNTKTAMTTWSCPFVGVVKSQSEANSAAGGFDNSYKTSVDNPEILDEYSAIVDKIVAGKATMKDVLELQKSNSADAEEEEE